ncbi:nucleotide cyclase [Lucifera butyrica]|uniref:Nucleotide cyclase n=1 Tax=Lucifera butyrica TaxID=1351585 RepID=A0A498R550_9FIRM|nr:MASE3 domain-containing protein [Lucifera butyrica]VBB05950.1 nucleotide cyclase [Lucifera butyrica]
MYPGFTVPERSKCLIFIILIFLPLVLISMFPRLFYVTFSGDGYLLIHTGLEFSSVVICFTLFWVVWSSWRHTKDRRDLVLAVTFLTAGMLDFAHAFSYPGMPPFFTANSVNKSELYWIVSRLVVACGLFGALFIRRRVQNSCLQREHLTGMAAVSTVALILLIAYVPELFPAMFAAGEGNTPLKVSLEYVCMALFAVSALLYGWRNPTKREIYFLRFSLYLSIAVEIAAVLYQQSNDSYNLLGHMYKLAANVFILKSLVETSILRPYNRVAQLARSLRVLVGRNFKQYKSVKENNKLLKQTFTSLGATLASGHNLDQMLQQVVQATATIFQCSHVYLALNETSPSQLKIAAYLSSFKPPEYLLPAKSFMGTVLTEKKAIVICDLREDPERLAPEWEIAGLRSMVGAPIRHNGDVIGVLGLFSAQTAGFTEEDAKFLTVFAHHAGVAIKNAKMFANTLQSFNELKLLYDIIKNIATELSPVALLTKVTHQLHELFYSDCAAAFIMHARDDGVHAEPVFVQQFSTGEINHLQRVFSDGQVAWPWADLSYLEQDLTEDQGLITMSVLMKRRLNILPLLSSGKLQGLIVFGWNNPKFEIPPGMEMILGTIAGQTAVGLERAYLYENVQKIALTDALTKLPNRRNFDSSLTRELNRAHLHGRKLSLLILDIDYFKKVNDTWGHVAGDAVLQQMGAMIREFFAGTSICARYGGEEFTVILPETGVTAAVEVADSFRRQVAERNFVIDAGTVIQVTVSIGVATIDTPAVPAITRDEMVERADQALYRAKQSGRNKVMVWKENSA